MKLGLLSDIHEAVEPTAAAIEELRRRAVDEIICLPSNAVTSIR